MSQKSKINRARREAEEEKKGKAVVDWILWALVGAAVLSALFISMNA
jgi:multisubunit Na+/H+ antiporter MnhB subunit